MEVFACCLTIIILALIANSARAKHCQAERATLVKLLAFALKTQKGVLETSDGTAVVQLLRIKRRLKRLLADPKVARDLDQD